MNDRSLAARIRIRTRGPITKMSDKHYHLIADIIRKIPDEATRKVCADHFATEFNRRSTAFDPLQWERATGGKPRRILRHEQSKTHRQDRLAARSAQAELAAQTGSPGETGPAGQAAREASMKT